MRRRDDGKAADRPSARDRALGLLARREHSRRELERKLAAKGYTPDESGPALSDLAQGCEQSDERYAEVLIRQRAGAGYGPRRIEAELQANGIAPARFREALAQIDWLAAARSLVARRYPGAADRATRDKAGQYLQRRGFPSGVIAKVLGEPRE